MKIRLDAEDGRCSVNITSVGVARGGGTYSELDIRASGDDLASALAVAINRFQELQNAALQKLREAGIMRGTDVVAPKGEPS